MRPPEPFLLRAQGLPGCSPKGGFAHAVALLQDDAVPVVLVHQAQGGGAPPLISTRAWAREAGSKAATG